MPNAFTRKNFAEQTCTDSILVHSAALAAILLQHSEDLMDSITGNLHLTALLQFLGLAALGSRGMRVGWMPNRFMEVCVGAHAHHLKGL